MGGFSSGIGLASPLLVKFHQRENFSFQEISDKYGLGKLDFFRYLQTRTYFNKEIRYMEKHDTNLIDLFIDMYKNKDNRKLVSKLYLAIQSIKKQSTNKVRLKWE